MRAAALAVLACLHGAVAMSWAAGPDLELKPGDHVGIVGNTLADRMQHDGWLEAHLQARFPKHELVIRNLGFSGDELTLRLRSANFGSPDMWLSSAQADVVFAFFGYNESFAGPEGVGKFKKDLDDFIKHTLAQRYNGEGAPKLVLFSPIAHEDLHDRNLPDGSENNKRLELYTAAMKEVAEADGVGFVDLFHPSRELYAKAAKPLTINGVHLTPEGDRQLAQAIDRALFPGRQGTGIDPQALEKVRQAVLDKNFYWFNRYRTVDGYSIFGGRADLRFVDGQTNRVVMQREMEVLDVMTANRDRRIWAVAQGGDLKVDDSNTPEFIPVKTNKPGPGPNGEHVFLGGEEAIGKMTVAKGMKVNLFASEERFPDLAKPVQMSFDNRGRLWVAVWPSYPHWKPKEEMDDKILIFEDTDGDGKADKQTTFARGLHNPTGFEFTNGGVLVAHVPDILFLKDTDGDDKADQTTRVLSGLDSADTHHSANSFHVDPGGAVYFQEGTFHHTQVETPYAPTLRNVNAAVYRYEPRTQKFEAYVTFSFANPHGHVFDRWGQDIVTDGTGAVPYHGTLFSGHLDYPKKHGRPPTVYKQRTRPCPGIEILSSRHFPEALQGNLLVGNVIGFQGILQYKVEDDDSSFSGTELEPIVFSSDPNFRPSDIEIGPDGAIYFLDWQNPIIGHMQHNLRDPSRDRTHGRIYRVTAEGRPLLKPVKIAGEPIEKLLDLLKEPEDRVRSRARIELGARDTDRVIAAVKTWAAALDKTDPDYEHLMMEALWVHQQHNVVDAGLLRRMLGSPEFRARAAATRVLCYWRDRVPDALGLLKTLAADPYPRVRLEAVRAASFFTVPEAIEVALISAEKPTDQYLEYTRGETMKALEPYWKKAVAEGRTIAFTSEAGARFFLRNVGTDELKKMKRTRPVDLELLFRKGVRDEDRASALADLARLEGKGELRVLLDAIRGQDAQKDAQDESVVFDLARLLTGRPAAELAGARADLEQIATGSNLPVTRQLGYVALIAADGGVDRAWALGTKSVAALLDLLGAMPIIRDPALRAALYPKVEPLLNGLPASLSSRGEKETSGRYVRVELPDRGVLSLVEVEVYSKGRNVARAGRASQKNTAAGGDAGLAIDGRTGAGRRGGPAAQTENVRNPYWEVDLGSEMPIDSVAVYNVAGPAGKGLDGFTLSVLDEKRNPVFRKASLPAPEPKGTYEVGGGEGAGDRDVVRRAAMIALTQVPGREQETFRALARFVRDGIDREVAIQAMQRIPARDWPQGEAAPLLESLIAHVRKIPARERTSPEAAAALQLADALAATLPADQARPIRKQLGELGVRVIRIGTVTDQMLFDKDRIVVEAGKPVEVVFENTDIMPHNFVVTMPGALEEVGLLSEATATDANAAERNYVPVTKKILLSSRLLQPRDLQKLSFTAPKEPSVYPYVCTYPGHWRRMYGAMYVVEDLDDYLADPEGYLASHVLPIDDELLKTNRPRKEWKLEDLASSVEQLDRGRSFATGKQMFQAASCVSCHRMNGVGEEIGPDLSRLDDKKSRPIEVLKSILEPSAEIHEKYQTFVFETDAGKVLTGLVLEETADTVKVIENPLARTQPVILKKAEIVERAKSPTSVMPKGLLDKLTREEILDLVSYVASHGEASSKLFQGGGHEHGHGPGR
jgi:putative heme-binding domain-containing protein